MKENVSGCFFLNTVYIRECGVLSGHAAADQIVFQKLSIIYNYTRWVRKKQNSWWFIITLDGKL